MSISGANGDQMLEPGQLMPSGLFLTIRPIRLSRSRLRSPLTGWSNKRNMRKAGERRLPPQILKSQQRQLIALTSTYSEAYSLNG